MASLFVALRTRQTSPRPVPRQGDLWRDMPFWQPSFYPPWSSPTRSLRAATARQVDRDADTLGLLGGRVGLRERYMNSNAFLARLVNLKDAPPSIEIYALSALRWGLEGGEPFLYDNIVSFQAYKKFSFQSMLIDECTTQTNGFRPQCRRL